MSNQHVLLGISIVAVVAAVAVIAVVAIVAVVAVVAVVVAVVVTVIAAVAVVTVLTTTCDPFQGKSNSNSSIKNGLNSRWWLPVTISVNQGIKSLQHRH